MNRKWIGIAVATIVGLGGTALAQQQQQGSSGVQNNPPQQSQQSQQGQSGNAQQGQQQGMMGQVKSVRLASLNQADVRQIQTHLKDIGFYKGTVDGNLGTDTKNALLSYFQSQVSLAQQGRISEGSLSGFGFDRNEIDRVRGIDQGNQGNARQPTQGQQQQQQMPQQQQQPQQERQY